MWMLRLRGGIMPQIRGSRLEVRSWKDESKAAYAIQGHAGRFIPRVEGCYFNIVGLPLSRLYHALVDLGWSED
jgi:predicted house-cleaning NTP pyrophosphatase (Maf/HAM1 superfamily)